MPSATGGSDMALFVYQWLATWSESRKRMSVITFRPLISIKRTPQQVTKSAVTRTGESTDYSVKVQEEVGPNPQASTPMAPVVRHFCSKASMLLWQPRPDCDQICKFELEQVRGWVPFEASRSSPS